MRTAVLMCAIILGMSAHAQDSVGELGKGIDALHSQVSQSNGDNMIRALDTAKVPFYPHPEPFLSTPGNRSLAVYEFMARGLDAMTTRIILTDPCQCRHEAVPGMKTIASHNWSMYTYSFGVAAGVTFVSAWMWHSSFTHPKHSKARRVLSRLLITGDCLQETAAVVNNSLLMEPDPSIN